MLNRVAITGLGAITPAGNTVEENWQSVVAGKSGIDFIQKFDTENFPIKIAGEVKANVQDFIEGKEIKHFDPFIQYALIATQEAVLDAGIQDLKDVGVVIGSGQGGISNIEREHSKLINGKIRRVTPFFIPSSVIGMASGVISSRFGFRGPSYGVSSACATSAHAIMDACKMIAVGEVDTVVTGGAEATITPLSLAGFSRLNALNTETENPQNASRPFDLQRSGFVSGEGAGIIVLENMASAIRRGATIYGEIAGFGATSDASHLTAPCPDGVGQSLAMQKAVDMANITPQQVGYINAHGTSTPLNDKIETLAIKNVFGDGASEVAISSTKSMTGHLLGAAGAVELIYCIEAIKASQIPPTINLKTPDPDCDLNYTANAAEFQNIEYALSNSFGFGGTNASLLLKKVA
ncbi:beta-ketoacyl-ACP synthase II [Aliikangiella coralliicola]|uniref:3-oxoacyl-[acyl-carrier-protein] synthase 2 n=1 Tax=Aliikangiella coralliicola TaxID=2592383 RepID=A0A545U0C7_9GAMM|nr:beta-ketoacyl-ACP synthase II [Aliikangiella coralliicola]TQV82918.1 beta-ketoacyl-ACP synthase II [Aliikangiella coralliicola]